MLARLCSKSFKQGFRSMWTKNFQKYKLDLEKAEEPEIKLPTLAGSWRKQGTPRKASTSVLAFACADHNKLWKILKKMGIPDHLNLRKLYVGQEATVKTGHETLDWFKIEKGGWQGCILSPCLFKFYAEYIRQMPGWMNHKLESRLPGEISTTSDM